MTTPSIRSLILATLLSVSALPALAADAARALIIQQREEVLSRILAHHEAKRAAGLADEEAVATAALALHVFRRETAQAIPDKIKHQEPVVRISKELLAGLETRLKSGMADPLQVLLATDRALEAQQVLEELKLAAAPAR